MRFFFGRVTMHSVFRGLENANSQIHQLTMIIMLKDAGDDVG